MTPLGEAFLSGFRDLGYVPGQNIIIDRRCYLTPAESRHGLSDFGGRRVDVLVVATDPVIQAARQATTTIPIVMVVAADPVGAGLVASLAKPGGNVTGLSMLAPDLAGKRLELLKATVPQLSRVAVLWNDKNSAKAREFRETETAAKSLGVKLQSLAVRDPDPAFEPPFSAMRQERAQALVLLDDALTFHHRAHLGWLAAQNRLPAMWESREFLDAGGG